MKIDTGPTTSSLVGLASYSRSMLEEWRSGEAWRVLVSKWLKELADLHGKENFRTRKGSAKSDVKDVCEEVFPLSIWMDNYHAIRNWEARFTEPGSRADVLLRASSFSLEVPLQIVGAVDGVESAAQMSDRC
jgi:hypothetical protein